MKKNQKLLISSFLALAFLASAVLISVKGNAMPSFVKSFSSYSFSFDENKRINNNVYPDSHENSSVVKTSQGADVTFTYSNTVSFEDGWQTILPNGYIYNPLTNTADHNKISGITSISFTSDDDCSLDLYYGYSINNTEIIYSNVETLTANTIFSFGDNHPSYFYLENNSGANIDINSLNIDYNCASQEHPYKNLKVLMIGNSFADDTLFYTARIANSYGINLELYDAYIAGCTVEQHYTNITNNNANYSMRRMNGDQWDYQDNKTLTQIVNYKVWDIITFQQASAEIGRPTTYSHLGDLVSQVSSLVGSKPKFYWHFTWAYDSDYHDYYDYFSYFNNDQDAMFSAMVDCYSNQVKPLGLFEKLIPAGTVVQNLRTSYMKETFTRDGKHMSSVHGRYLLGLDFINQVLDIDLNKSPCNYLPNEVNPSFMNVAKEAIYNARRKPLEVTNSVYTTSDIGTYDLTNYTEIDAGLLGCSFWNSTDSSNFDKRQANLEGTSNLYVSSSRFTPSTLPVGSIVSIGESFGVRPDAWTSDSVQYSRPSETYQNIIEIDNDFWNGYQFRAFNIFKCAKTTLMGQYSQIFDEFHIYVPNELVGGLKVKSVNDKLETDRGLFANNYLNIDSFERIHLDPITGFYKCDSYYELRNSYVDSTAKRFVCTRPFYSSEGDLPENTVIVVDSGYQWRSDCWGSHGSYSPRPNNVANRLTRLDASFWSGFRRRTFNVSSTSDSVYVGQNHLEYMDHLRIYVPVSDDITIEPEATVAMTALGYAELNSVGSSVYGKSSIPVLITLHGDNTNKVYVQVDGTDIGATSYSFDKDNGTISIQTTGSAAGYTYGIISGNISSSIGRITNMRINGSLSSFITNNGSIVCSELYFDNCNYNTNASSQAVWQRWYMYNSSWQANSGVSDWTIPSSAYLFDKDYSMGLRIANNSYQKTRFTLKNDLNGGAGMAIHGISIWLFNPNGNIYSSFRIYLYKTPSTTSGDHAVPSSTYTELIKTSNIGDNEWRYITCGYVGTVYNVSLYFETASSATTYVYLGHVSIY